MMSLRKIKLFIGFFLITLSFAHSSQAETLTNFQADFEVQALGMTLGKAKHHFTCHGADCTLTSSAKPSGLAALMSSDSSQETISLHQTADHLQWLAYNKVGKTEKQGKPIEKQRKLILNPLDNTISSYKNQRLKKQWPATAKTYDAVSLAYAIQFAVLNQQPLTDFVLQDIAFQDSLKLVATEPQQPLELPFLDDSIEANKYQFSSQHTQITLWLVPTLKYFPSKIQIINHNDKTITLHLAEPPKFYETQR